MVLTPHAVVAGALGQPLSKIRSRSLRISAALTVGVASHVMLDRIPHTDYSPRLWPVLLADLLLASFMTRRYRLMGWCAFGGVLPDLVQGFERAAKLSITRPTHQGWHTSVHISFTGGILTQVLVILMGLSLAKLLRDRKTELAASQPAN